MATEPSEDSPGEEVAEGASDKGPTGDDSQGPDRLSDERNDEDVVEIARELVLDLRAEFPRLDARAAAGVALTGALLVSVVNQASLPMPIYAFGVLAAVLLTIALLTFLAVLFPSPGAGWRYVDDQVEGEKGQKPTWRVADPAAAAERLAAGLAATGRIAYYSSVVVDMSAQVRTKQRLLWIAFLSGLVAVATLALGASTALLLGWR